MISTRQSCINISPSKFYLVCDIPFLLWFRIKKAFLIRRIVDLMDERGRLQRFPNRHHFGKIPISDPNFLSSIKSLLFSYCNNYSYWLSYITNLRCCKYEVVRDDMTKAVLKITKVCGDYYCQYTFRILGIS